jgi:hypothetical protein
MDPHHLLRLWQRHQRRLRLQLHQLHLLFQQFLLKWTSRSMILL